MKFLYSASVLALVAGLVAPAAAQTSSRGAAVANQPEQSAGDPADIIVTAQKREQSLQDVPIVVTVLSQAQLQNAGVRDIKDLQTITPGLNVTSSTSQAQTSIRIRGIGTVGDNPGLESSVGTIIDGVYRARSTVAFGDLGDIERIEVLKGPQSTLFGKNTSAGVINVVTAGPSFTPAAEVVGSYGNYGAYTVSANATAGLVGDTVAGRIFVLKRQRDGYMHVRTGGGPRNEGRDYDEDYYTFRGQLLFRPVSNVDVRLIGDYSKRNENCCVDVVTVAGPTAGFIDALAPDAGLLRPADPYSRIAYANRDTTTRIKDWGFSAQLDWDISDRFSATAISAYRDWRGENGVDLDYSTADVWYRPVDRNFNEFKVFSQEARIAYASDRLNSIVGAFYSNEQLHSVQSTFFGSGYEPYLGLLLSGGASQATVSALTGRPVGTNFLSGQGQSDTHRHRSEGIAVFTDNTLTLVKGLDVTLGLRYTDETKSVTSMFSNTSPAFACAAALARPIPAAAKAALCAPNADSAFDNVTTQQRRNERRFAGSAKVQYRFSPEAMIYGSYANGFKSGGFNLDRGRFGPGLINPDTEFATEKVQSYETGLKTTLFNRRLLANIAGFYQDYRGFQLNTFTGISFLVASIPKVTSKGVDLDLLWNTGIQGLTINAGATYADTRFGDFVPGPGISPNLPNNTLPYAAKWNVTGGFSSRQGVTSDLDFTASTSVKWTSEYNTGSNLDPRKVQTPFAFVNGRIGLTPKSNAWSIELWAQNLFDAEFYQVVVDQPLQSGTLGAYLGQPRTFGATGRVRF